MMPNGGLTISYMNGKKHMTEHIYNHLTIIYDRINKADKINLFLDYDGTLVYFKNRPKDVITSNKVKNVLHNLSQNPKFNIFIISGRTLHEIKQLINIKGLSFAALHGLQIELSSGKSFFWKEAENLRPSLDILKEILLYKFKDEKGLFIEDKEFTLAFHYRLLSKEKAKDVIENFSNIFKKINTNNMLEVIYGAKVIEARPKGWHKGKAVELILKNISENKNFLPIYIGDDITDEDAFKQLGKKGITIYVTNDSKSPTAAQYYLKDPDEVINFLQSLSLI
jgi:trehalose-phosphatase